MTMNFYNLLPEDAQDSLKLEYRLRTAILYVSGAGAGTIVGLVGLFSVWVLLQSEGARLAEEQNQLSLHNQAQSKTPASVVIGQTREKLTALMQRSQAPKPTEVFEVILAARSPHVSITKISYTASADKLSSVEILGVSAGREDLIAFTNALQTQGMFGGVDLPVDVFARSTDIPFTVTLRPAAPAKP